MIVSAMTLLLLNLEPIVVANPASNYYQTIRRHAKKMMKIGSSYSLWNDVMKGIPQGSILRHLIYFLLKNLNI